MLEWLRPDWTVGLGCSFLLMLFSATCFMGLRGLFESVDALKLVVAGGLLYGAAIFILKVSGHDTEDMERKRAKKVLLENQNKEMRETVIFLEDELSSLNDPGKLIDHLRLAKLESEAESLRKKLGQ